MEENLSTHAVNMSTQALNMSTLEQDMSTQTGIQFKIITAFSDNYTVGKLCAKVNTIYAKNNKYWWWKDVLTQEQMLEVVSPRTHCTWYKVHMFLDELKRALADFLVENEEENRNVQSKHIHETMKTTKKPLPLLNGSTSGGEVLKEGDYLVWMDADAVFIDHDKKLEDIVMRAEYKDLIIGEDMHVGNLVNCGVILIKVSTWSLKLWEKVFACRKYDDVTYFEQSALHKVLKMNKEFAPFFNVNQCHGGRGKNEKDQNGKIIIEEDKKVLTPWHSFCINNDNDHLDFNNKDIDGANEVKVFEHSSIFPMHLLNSNIFDEDIDFNGTGKRSIRQHRKCQHKNWIHQKAQFIFHAAGFSRKMSKISTMVKIRLPHIDLSEFDNMD